MNINASSPLRSRIRDLIWPIYGAEVKKVAPLVLMFFLISFTYHLLRCMKITLIVKAEGSGAAVIPFLKIWAVLPAAVLFTAFYTKVASNNSRRKTIYKTLSMFIAFFIVFLYVLYPYQQQLAPVFLSNLLQSILPSGAKGFIMAIHHWPITLFFVFAEMWSVIILSVMFWGFVNEVTAIDEAKRFYAVIALGANMAGILSGQLLQYISLDSKIPWIPYGSSAWEQTLFLQINIIIVLTCIITLLFNTVNNLQKKNFDKLVVKKKLKYNLEDSFKLLKKSRYIAYLTIIVLAYNVVSNMADVLWTNQLDLRFANAAALNKYLGKLDTFIGIVSVIISLFIFSNIIRRFGWFYVAIIPPLIWLCGSILLFVSLTFEHTTLVESISGMFLHLPINELIILIGTLQMGLGKASKYTFFDQAKEIAFIPLKTSTQRKGKAIIDGIASRFGKSGGCLILIGLIFFCGSLNTAMPIAITVILVMLCAWIYAVAKLWQIMTKRNPKTSGNKLIPKDKIIPA